MKTRILIYKKLKVEYNMSIPMEMNTYKKYQL